MKQRYVIVLAVVFIVLLLDQALKIWVKSSLSYADSIPLIGDWFHLNYVENQGMAFGATLGGGIWGKLVLSVFRMVAIGAIAYYIVTQIKQKAKMEFLVVGALVFAGALGNLIDSMFYDFFFEFDPCLNFNHLKGSGIWMECVYADYGFSEQVEVRNTGFLFGNVVDMFQFQVSWPSWVPWLGGDQVFPAIWNLADAAISVGVILVIIRNKVYFPKAAEEGENSENKEE